MGASIYHIVDGTAPSGLDLGSFHFFGIDAEFENVDGDGTMVGKRLKSQRRRRLTGYGARHVRDPDEGIKMTAIRLYAASIFSERIRREFSMTAIVYGVC